VRSEVITGGYTRLSNPHLERIDTKRVKARGAWLCLFYLAPDSITGGTKLLTVLFSAIAALLLLAVVGGWRWRAQSSWQRFCLYQSDATVIKKRGE